MRLISDPERRRWRIRAALGSTQTLLFVCVALAGLGPLYWMFKAAVSPTQEILAEPLRLWPSHARWENLSLAWNQQEIGRYTLNTAVLVLGSWLLQIFVCTTGGYALSVLKPRFGPVVYGAILATLFIPGVVSMVPLYLTTLDLGLIDSPWAVWLPNAVSAFNILLVKRFFDGIPAELYEAAEVDGAGPVRIFARIVLPMSTPILTVTSLLAVLSEWKMFLWPILVLPTPEKQPLGAALPRLAQTSEESLIIAGLFIASIPPLIIFVVFQRYILRGISFTGVKG